MGLRWDTRVCTDLVGLRARGRDRTDYLVLTMDALCQLSYPGGGPTTLHAVLSGGAGTLAILTTG